MCGNEEAQALEESQHLRITGLEGTLENNLNSASTWSLSI